MDHIAIVIRHTDPRYTVWTSPMWYLPCHVSLVILEQRKPAERLREWSHAEVLKVPACVAGGDGGERLVGQGFLLDFPFRWRVR